MNNKITINSLTDFIQAIDENTKGIKLYKETLDYFFKNLNKWHPLYEEVYLNKVFYNINNYLNLSINELEISEKKDLIEKAHFIYNTCHDNLVQFFPEDFFYKKMKNLEKNSPDISEQEKTKKKNFFSPISYYYRGEASADWDTLPNVLRNEKNWTRESFYFHEIQVRSPKDFENQTNLCKLVTMQHYKTPTRLLDITSNPLNALYFACEDETQKGDDGKVIIFPVFLGNMSYSDSDKALILSCIPHLEKFEQDIILNEIKYLNKLNKHKFSGENDVLFLNKLLLEICVEKPAFQPRIWFGDLLNPLFVKPNMTNPRIVNQQGAFLLSGISASIEETRDKIKALMAQTHIIVPKDRKELILKQLDSIGINKATIYPNLEKIAEYLKEL